MKIWVEDEALIRRRRQMELKRLDAWLLAHPHKSTAISVLLGFLLFGLAQLLGFAIEAIARSMESFR
jgi:uncharacterized membrane protein